MTIKVPLFVPEIGEPEVAAVTEVLRSGWIAMGPACETFERRFADLLGVRHAVAVNSCTAALHLANRLLDLGPDDEAIVPSLTFAATANALQFVNATPVFADITSRQDWTISPADVEQRITERTKAVIVMHYGGHPCDMDAFTRICAKHDLHLIEDACHGLGGSYNGQAMGTFGRIGCFSFYSNKIMTTAEGGMLVTNDAALAERARLLRSHGMTATAYDRQLGAPGYDIVDWGYNFRLDDVRATLGLCQLDRLDRSLERRREIVQHYRQRLADVEEVIVPDFDGRPEPAHYIFTIALEGPSRSEVRKLLQDQGIQTSIHYQPVHRFAQYRQDTQPLTNTEWAADRTLTLPLYPALSDAQVDSVVDALLVAIKQAGPASDTSP